MRRSVAALLDDLAPERVLSRSEQPRGPVECYRTRYGCVLQGAPGAVSLSWFPEDTASAGPGELHVRAWHGVLRRRGASSNRQAAVLASELVLQPVESPSHECMWRAADGASYDTVALSARCRALLLELMAPVAD